MCHTDNLILLESGRLQLTVDPSRGGKLRSLISKHSGKEFFYQDRRKSFDAATGYSHHDISGYDECFPSVAACRGDTPGGSHYDYPDHGLLWQRAWDCRERDGVLMMSCDIDELQCAFTRCCSFELEHTLLLEYRIENYGDANLPYVYSAHPLLTTDGMARVVLPEDMTQAYSYASADNSGLPNGEWIDMSAMNQSDISGPFSPCRHTFIKLFSDRLANGKAAVEYQDSSERLELSFDTAALPYLGFLAQQGYDTLTDGYFTGECLLAFEPTTGIGDDLPTSMRTNTLTVLSAGCSLSFWIRIRVEAHGSLRHTIVAAKGR